MTSSELHTCHSDEGQKASTLKSAVARISSTVRGGRHALSQVPGLSFRGAKSQKRIAVDDPTTECATARLMCNCARYIRIYLTRGLRVTADGRTGIVHDVIGERKRGEYDTLNGPASKLHRRDGLDSDGIGGHSFTLLVPISLRPSLDRYVFPRQSPVMASSAVLPRAPTGTIQPDSVPAPSLRIQLVISRTGALEGSIVLLWIEWDATTLSLPISASLPFKSALRPSLSRYYHRADGWEL
ncbi:hypothetical protein PRIPAC_87544, partial [Pristionchus pacificus]|uniref:Uncharacterized protein n=1 Tax=Pristionchus pacificus TaxID=54126 RepID=A0A2A6B8W4_PRIPA